MRWAQSQIDRIANGRYVMTARPRPPRQGIKSGTARQLEREAALTWLILIIAGLFEVVWAFTMKLSDGFTRLWPSIVTIAAMLVSFALLSWAMRSLSLGTAYAVWTGIGAVGAFVAGIVFLGETADPPRLFAALLIVSGLLLMNLSSPG